MGAYVHTRIRRIRFRFCLFFYFSRLCTAGLQTNDYPESALKREKCRNVWARYISDPENTSSMAKKSLAGTLLPCKIKVTALPVQKARALRVVFS